ncbi:Protein CBG04885 [Caenorhabditis briggsae]|uniref:Protein CBG04852 n=1 Tax=Caenorhabditis briggsae TaxID=6238 RepID=G2J6G3_CAEBR|nr:Protein CBG04852 [Caenorhabditis briggsae]XP_045092796.1 Protein CBG04885 [Caenorhabditis briggsae]CAP25482.2 Protein CBG04852 [Caenorhabditis briggsae]CAP25511.2 Protein CBG04885 [Caenorhabditis briggsae]
MKLLSLVFLVPFIAAIFLEGNGNGGERHHSGGGGFSSSSSSSGSSGSSEEHGHHHGHRPPYRPPHRPPPPPRKQCDEGWMRFERPNGLIWCIYMYRGVTACIQQFIISPNFVAGPNDYASWKAAFNNGDLDKYTCQAPAYPYTRYYACGKVGAQRTA